jgi:NADH dehydrogenase
VNVKHVVVVGGGFVGINAAKLLSQSKNLKLTVIDRCNHHLFQPLLYQVAAAGLSPAEIAVPIRSLLSDKENVRVVQDEIQNVDPDEKVVHGKNGEYHYDYLIMAAGATHNYFGNEDWELNAPGLKTLAQATEIRRRIMTAFEKAEIEEDTEERKKLLTFVVVGGGPTGVELAGAIGEMTRFTLARDFRRIDPKLTRIILVEAGSRILSSFDESLSSMATRDLESLGVQVWTQSAVSKVTVDAVIVGSEKISSATVLWAAGVKGSSIGDAMKVELDSQGRIKVKRDLSLPGYKDVFVAGDQACFIGKNGEPLPSIAPVAMQQGRHIAKNIIKELDSKPRKNFFYLDKGQMATIGRKKAIVEVRGFRFGGFIAWIAWLFIHIFYLSGFKNRVIVLIQWGYSYFSFARGARLIIDRNWRSFGKEKEKL